MKDSSELLRHAIAAHRQGKIEEAEGLYAEALTLSPESVEARHMLGVIRIQQGRPEEAIRLISEALARKPGDVHAECDLGFACQQVNRHDEAIAHYNRALSLRPDDADTLFRLGLSAFALGRPADAVDAYTKALRIRADEPATLIQRAVAWRAMSRYAEALEDLDRALVLSPRDADAWYLRGRTAVMFDLLPDVAANFAMARELDPDIDYLHGALVHARGYLCDWRQRDHDLQDLADAIAAGRHTCFPLVALTLFDDPERQLKAARLVADRLTQPEPLPAISAKPRSRKRIRVAYLSNHYYEHATAYLISELLERHDRDRFELFAVSYGPEGGGGARARIERAVERFFDVRTLSDRNVATLLRGHEADIAIDLMGHVGGARPGIVALRSAPIQVNYLGYPGTTGAEFIDYIIADPFIIPAGSEGGYAEQVVRLPECYQPNDTKRRIAERTPTRTELGLPEGGFVFCSFNASYKFNPAMFDLWMRLLRQIDGSVLWLLSLTDVVANNLRSEAERRGIAASRLVFAPRLPLETHLARHQAADLFLDTLPCNAHTTASDALWAGLPVLTCAGRSFAARVAGSLLRAVGLPELVTGSLAEYEALALALAQDPARLTALRARLGQNRASAPLFDIERYTRHLESAYETMWSRHLRGEPPRAFDVPGDPPLTR